MELIGYMKVYMSVHGTMSGSTFVKKKGSPEFSTSVVAGSGQVLTSVCFLAATL